MAAPFNTLLLDVLAWDLTVDAAGNIAMASPPYSLAQDASSAIRTFKGECWFDTTIGVAYNLILGQSPNIAALKSAFVQAASTVPGVLTAKCFITSLVERRLTGQVQVTDVLTGTVSAANFASVPIVPGLQVLTNDQGTRELQSDDGSQVLTAG